MMKLIHTLLAAAAGTTALLAHAEPVTYTLDPSHTGITWEALHAGTSTLRGYFAVKEGGSITVDRAAKSGKLDIGIDLLSLNTPVKSLENGLKGDRGFNVSASPTARFTSERFTFDGDKPSAIDGTLAVLGKTIPVTLRAVRFNCYDNPMLKREVCGGDFEGTVSRSQLGVNLSPQGAADNVRLLVEVEAVKTQ